MTNTEDKRQVPSRFEFWDQTQSTSQPFQKHARAFKSDLDEGFWWLLGEEVAILRYPITVMINILPIRQGAPARSRTVRFDSKNIYCLETSPKVLNLNPCPCPEPSLLSHAPDLEDDVSSVGPHISASFSSKLVLERN